MNSSESHTPYSAAQPGAFSVSHLVHTLRKYAAVITMAMIAVMIVYAILALLFYLRNPSRRVTSLQFRLQFSGASSGRYPNGLIFAASDVTDTSVLLNVYRANHLEQFLPFEQFSNSVFVTSLNFEYQLLAMQYDARLADPKLSPIDRDRIEREYQHKRDSLSKSDYAIAFNHQPGAELPQQVTYKVLSDILAAWGRRAVYDRRVLLYPVTVMTTKVLDRSLMERNDYVISLAVLRNRVAELISNIDTLSTTVPGITQIRTHDQLSLGEIEVQLEDLLRFQLDPLITTARSSGMVKNATFDLRVLEAQLAYNQRRLDAARMREAAIRNSFAAYEQTSSVSEANTMASATGTPGGAQQTTPPARSGGENAAVVNDSFLDRIVDLAGREADRDFRQKMVREIQAASMDVVPAQEAVSYSAQLLNDFKSGSPLPSTPETAELLRNGSAEAFSALESAINHVYEIYTTSSKLTNPTTQIYTETAAPTTRIDRTTSIFRLILYGIAVFLVTLPLVVILALLHNRVQEEEEEERALTPSAA